MRRLRGLAAEMRVAFRTFLRRRTAMMFTFLFPAILVVIFGALVRTDPTATGLFARSPTYYVPAYIAVVILFTPLSRMSATVIRYREGRRFEKLATTPLSRGQWLIAHTVITAGIVLIATVIILLLVTVLTTAPLPRSPVLLPFIVGGVGFFAGLGAVIGRFAKTEDGAIAVSNTIALPMLFLADTFVPPTLLPAWFRPAIELIPLTFCTRGMRAVVTGSGGWAGDLAVVGILGGLSLIVAAGLLPWTE